MAASLKAANEVTDVIDLDDSTEHSPECEVIDLCAPNPRRKKARPSPKSSDDDDIVVVEENRGELSAEEKYRHAVGPTRMGFVSSWQPAHHFANSRPSARLPKTLYAELLEYKLNLPISKNSSIFIRAQDSRMDLLRCMITGPADTPYSLGCFLFDIVLSDYPHKPPNVKFLTTDSGRVRFNPNLYACGKVCLSLLGTWSGPSWLPGQSTLLQVLISIQGLILVGDPYFNEPGYERSRGTPMAKTASEQYSKQVRQACLRVAIAAPLAQLVRTAGDGGEYPEFREAMVLHFVEQEPSLRDQVTDWVARDSSLQSLGEKVMHDLDTLVALYNRKKEPETIEILEE